MKRISEVVEHPFLSKDGHFVLATVKRIVSRKGFSYGPDWYQIFFEEAWARLAVTALHSFVIIRDTKELCKKGVDLQPGDKVWLDVHMLSADGSLIYNS